LAPIFIAKVYVKLKKEKFSFSMNSDAAVPGPKKKSFSTPTSTATSLNIAQNSKRKIPLLSQTDAPMHELSHLTAESTMPTKRTRQKGDHDSDEEDDPLSSLVTAPSSKQALRTAVGTMAAELNQHDSLEDDEKDFEDGTASFLEKDWKKRQTNIRQRMEFAYRGMKGILDKLSPQAQRRYDTFRRSAIQKSVLRKWIAHYLSNSSQVVKDLNLNVSSVHPNVTIVMVGIAKVYVGQLLETALQMQQEWNDSPTQGLLPSHIRAAYLRLQQKSGNLSQSSFVFQSKKRYL
jgi:transcription initiation factor TFIID subunit 11